MPIQRSWSTLAYDNISAIKSIREASTGPYGHIVKEIKARASEFQLVNFVHDNRASNVGMHNVARSSVYVSVGHHVWFVSPPDALLQRDPSMADEKGLRWWISDPSLSFCRKEKIPVANQRSTTGKALKIKKRIRLGRTGPTLSETLARGTIAGSAADHVRVRSIAVAHVRAGSTVFVPSTAGATVEEVEGAWIHRLPSCVVERMVLPLAVTCEEDGAVVCRCSPPGRIPAAVALLQGGSWPPSRSSVVDPGHRCSPHALIPAAAALLWSVSWPDPTRRGSCVHSTS